VVRDDGPMLLTAFAAGVAMLATWTVGIWGKSASLTEAALPPPYNSDFFLERMNLWVDAITPWKSLLAGEMTLVQYPQLLIGPLFIVGVVGLMTVGFRRAAEDDLTTVSIVWLAPLAGLFGFIGGLTYPYYRFFNTTLSWVLLVGIGAWVAIRFFTRRAGGWSALAIVAALVLAVVFGASFARGFELSGWNDPAKGWLSSEERTDLDAVREAINSETNEDTPVVFVIDFDPESFDNSFQVWGDTKLAGNTSRYGMPPGQIDQSYMYLGSLENALNDEPTVIGDVVEPNGEECDTELLGEETYDCLSNGLLANIREGTEDREPVYVVPAIFNETGANAEMLSDEAGAAEVVAGAEQVWLVSDGEVTGPEGEAIGGQDDEADSGGILHLLRVLLCLVLMLVPGYLALRYFFPDATIGEAVGMVPALSFAIVTLTGIVVLSILRSPLEGVLAWLVLALAIGVGAVLRISGSRRQSPAAQ
jgi:hypothetical protein